MNSTLQPSNQLHLNWSSRLEENLGTYKADLLRSRVDIFLSNKLALDVFNTISALCLSTLAERDPIPGLYKNTIILKSNNLNEIDGGGLSSFNNTTVLGDFNNDGFILFLDDVGSHDYIFISFDADW